MDTIIEGVLCTGLSAALQFPLALCNFCMGSVLWINVKEQQVQVWCTSFRARLTNFWNWYDQPPHPLLALKRWALFGPFCSIHQYLQGASVCSSVSTKGFLLAFIVLSQMLTHSVQCRKLLGFVISMYINLSYQNIDCQNLTVKLLSLSIPHSVSHNNARDNTVMKAFKISIKIPPPPKKNKDILSMEKCEFIDLISIPKIVNDIAWIIFTIWYKLMIVNDLFWAGRTTLRSSLHRSITSDSKTRSVKLGLTLHLTENSLPLSLRYKFISLPCSFHPLPSASRMV